MENDPRIRMKAITLLAFFCLIPHISCAHSGRTDASGGHYNRKTSEYHDHNKKSPSPPPPPKPIPNITVSRGIVTHVTDGDTLVVEINGQKENIRLLDIDAPELDTSEGKVAKAYVSGLVEDKVLSVQHNNIRDKYGRLLATLYVDGKNLKERLELYLNQSK